MNSIETKSIDILTAREASKSGIAMGAFLAVFGVLAMIAPHMSGIAVTVMIGMLMIAGGIMQTIFAFKAESFGKGVLVFLFGGLGVVAGVIILVTPQTSLAFLTLMLSGFFVASGAADIVLGLNKRPDEGWGWMLLSGAMSVLLGILTFAEWPVSALWLLGFYVGVRMLMHGWVMMSLGRAGQVALTQMQDERIEMLEHHVRRGAVMIQDVVQTLANHTAALLVLDSELRKKVATDEIDPAIGELNNQLHKARKSVEAVEAASQEAWDDVQRESHEVLGKLQSSVADLTEKLRNSLGIDKPDEG
jgi:uncharacterized membrane protein HdeD (DUF308 family)